MKETIDTGTLDFGLPVLRSAFDGGGWTLHFLPEPIRTQPNQIEAIRTKNNFVDPVQMSNFPKNQAATGVRPRRAEVRRRRRITLHYSPVKPSGPKLSLIAPN